MNEYLSKHEILKNINLNIAKWKELKKKGSYDVTHENFLDDVILVYEWVLNDIEKM